MPGTEGEPRGLPGKPSVIVDAIRDSGLVSEGDRGVVLVSGGADSVALLTGLTETLGSERLIALHVNYDLREESDGDEELVRQVCEGLGVDLEVYRAGSPKGNRQAWAREIRLGEAERIRSAMGLDWVAVGHNRTDQAETFLYRLVSSPGARSLLAMPPRSGRVIRPLLGLERDLIRRVIDELSPYAEDRSNEDISYARNRIRLEVLPEFELINPAAVLNIVRSRAELEEDEEILAHLAAEAGEAATSKSGSGLEWASLGGQHPAIRRRVLRQLAEETLGRPVAVSREIEAEVERLATKPGGGSVDLGSGDRFVMRRHGVEVLRGGGTGGEEPPDQAPVALPSGATAFGDWTVESDLTDEGGARAGFGDPWTAYLDHRDLLEWPETSPRPDSLVLRSWRAGDRIEPLGMTGSKKLQDVFTDALVPAPRRRSWPVAVAGETVIWVPGLARSKHLLIGGPGRQVLRLRATPPFDR